MTDTQTTTNGTTKEKQARETFKIERSLMGVANAFMQIAEEVCAGSLGVNEAKEATRALNGVPAIVKTQLEAIKIFEKGSDKAREQAARILDLGMPSDQKALPTN